MPHEFKTFITPSKLPALPSYSVLPFFLLLPASLAVSRLPCSGLCQGWIRLTTSPTFFVMESAFLPHSLPGCCPTGYFGPTLAGPEHSCAREGTNSQRLPRIVWAWNLQAGAGTDSAVRGIKPPAHFLSSSSSKPQTCPHLTIAVPRWDVACVTPCHTLGQGEKQQNWSITAGLSCGSWWGWDWQTWVWQLDHASDVSPHPMPRLPKTMSTARQVSAITWQRTGEQRSWCCPNILFTVITANQASLWPVLTYACVITHFDSLYSLTYHV